MNLYKIIFEHHSPLDSEEGIKTYLLANNTEEVYEYMLKRYWLWRNSKDEKLYPVYNYDYEEICTESFREKMLRINGEIHEEDPDLSDAYSGITLYGWELIDTPPDTDFSDMIKLGIVKVGYIRKHDDFL